MNSSVPSLFVRDFYDRFNDRGFIVRGSISFVGFVALLIAVVTHPRYMQDKHEGVLLVMAWGLLAIYGLAYASRAMRSLSGAPQAGAVLAALVVLSAFGAYSHIVELSPTLWTPATSEDQEAGDMPPSVAESLLFDQRDQIDEAVDRMSAGASGHASANPAVFFVGFAGVAEQRVFAEEIKLAAHASVLGS